MSPFQDVTALFGATALPEGTVLSQLLVGAGGMAALFALFGWMALRPGGGRTGCGGCDGGCSAEEGEACSWALEESNLEERV